MFRVNKEADLRRAGVPSAAVVKFRRAAETTVDENVAGYDAGDMPVTAIVRQHSICHVSIAVGDTAVEYGTIILGKRYFFDAFC